jgi:S1-C subfamily serine protease
MNRFLPFPAVASLLLTVWVQATQAQCPGGVCRPIIGGQSRSTIPIPDLREAGPQQVGRITVLDRDGTISCGSCVLVSVAGNGAALVLTNSHVVCDRSDNSSIRVQLPGCPLANGVFIMDDPVMDLAAIEVKDEGVVPVAIAETPPAIGDTLTLTGYGPNGAYREDRGPVSVYTAPEGTTEPLFVESGATPRHGDSGGGVFNERGQLVGVLWGGQARRSLHMPHSVSLW